MLKVSGEAETLFCLTYMTLRSKKCDAGFGKIKTLFLQ